MDKVTAVVWDCDGTLLDSEALFAKAWQLVMNEYDIQISNETMITYVGIDDRIIHAELSKVAELPNFENTMEMLHNEVRNKFYEKELIFPDVLNSLEFFKKHNIQQGCASASPEKILIEKLTKSDIVGYFETIFGGDMVVNNKPSPEIYLEVFKALDVQPQNVLIIEDSPYGIESGKRSGARVLAIDRGVFSQEQLQEADFKSSHLDLNFFESLI